MSRAHFLISSPGQATKIKKLNTSLSSHNTVCYLGLQNVPPKPCSTQFSTEGEGSQTPGLPSLTSQCPAVARWAVAPAFLLWGELLGGQAKPVGSRSWLLCRRPSSWARERFQQPAVRLHKLPYVPDSFGIGRIPSGNEGKAPSELDKSCSGAGGNRYLTSLNFQCSSFQRHMLCLNLLQIYSFAYHSACMSSVKFY